ncbi:hypothetical protein D3W54_15930 (plasmid) [Komagataeibacter medellinensis]|uniref:Uncharacterized protein n=1 Tax=Komagataeibacter medellinensis TaxID=1177712 RepID=A0ABQ6VQP5_9PROT|nr:hypothetical protein [Komagataeibacter medellinensis]KAB8122197.1 hypothetical protein D3W54_15930 [Komagataeibacter medellinensis]
MNMTPKPVKVGDLFKLYKLGTENETRFYEVVKATGEGFKQSVMIREVGHIADVKRNGDLKNVVPIRGDYLGPAFRRKVHLFGIEVTKNEWATHIG